MSLFRLVKSKTSFGKKKSPKIEGQKVDLRLIRALGVKSTAGKLLERKKYQTKKLPPAIKEIKIFRNLKRP